MPRWCSDDFALEVAGAHAGAEEHPRQLRLSRFGGVSRRPVGPAKARRVAAVRGDPHRHPVPAPGRPEEIAAAVVFCASAPASWVSGVNLPVDGGGSRANLWALPFHRDALADARDVPHIQQLFNQLAS